MELARRARQMGVTIQPRRAWPDHPLASGAVVGVQTEHGAIEPSAYQCRRHVGGQIAAMVGVSLRYPAHHQHLRHPSDSGS